MSPLDPVLLLKKLIQCPSITPHEGGALKVLEEALTSLGFQVERIVFHHEGEADVENLYARYGTKEPHLMFAGHTDVVPPGDEENWIYPPFSGEIYNGEIYGRGAVDMKGGIACFVAALSAYLDKNDHFFGSISLLITGDEEGPAINGTEKLLQYMTDKGEVWNACIVGEPTNIDQLGDTIKIGRRGSMSARVTVKGIQGHVAYPHLADNPVRGAIMMMAALMNPPLDEGTKEFPPTSLEITSVDVGNPALNVIAEKVTFQFNIRFNNIWDEKTLKDELKHRLEQAAKDPVLRPAADPVEYEIDFINRVSPVFLTHDSSLVETMCEAVKTATGCIAKVSTTGGTSDARFIKDYCPVIEFGLVGQTMHMINERAMVGDVKKLTQIYGEFLNLWFKSPK